MLTFTNFLLLENCSSSFIHSSSASSDEHHRQYVVAVGFLVAVWFEKFFLAERGTVERVSTDRQTDREKEKAFYSAEKVNMESQQKETLNSARHSRET